MKKLSLLAASVAIALTGCGGSDNDDSSTSTTQSSQSGVEITAIDGYLKNAAVWVDTNENLILDISEDTKLDIVTNEYGKFTLPEKYKSQTVFIQAVAGQTEDTTRGFITEDFSLASTSGSTVVNPMTNMVVKKVANQLKVDSTLDIETAIKEAKKAVVEAVTKSGLKVDASMIFGDYIAKADESKEAQALNAIGEVLVDNADIDVEKQLEVADLVAKEANDIIENNGNVADFAPVITIPADDNPVVVEKNHRPTSSQTIEPITVVLGDVIASFTVSFTDSDDDKLTYELKVLKVGDGLHGLSIDSTTGEISGTPVSAGVFTYQVFATDEHKARSYPLTFTVTVEAPNTAPVINEDVKVQLQDEISTWQWVEGEQPLDTLNISALFDDADSDILTYRVLSSLSVNSGEQTGFQVLQDSNGNVSFDGPVPNSAEAGAEHLYVYAKDSVNADEPYVMFELPAIAEGTTVDPEPPLTAERGFTEEHFDGRVWKMGSFAGHDGEIGYATLKKGLNGLEFCWGSSDLETTTFYKGNISNQGIELLSDLDSLPSYLDYQNQDCWGVTLENGTLKDEGGFVSTVLYQNITMDNQYQMLVKIGSEQLFWLDSTNTPFAQTLAVAEKVAESVVEYDMTVEATSGHIEELDGPELSYASGKLTYQTDTYAFESILPTGFHTPGNYRVEQDGNGADQLVLEETGEMSDYKTRYRYVNRDFGDFYIGIKWSTEQNFVSSKDYGLYTRNEQLMQDLLSNYRIIQD
ncbi:putative Ig domain-containing protein [Vibrio japonicus]|uniref:Ig domain-containing protein n=1 Tax=Vibrio japonicus TaxID=1824638 RepID=A0ABY5LGT7_9VIBR|nr:putative Ig domain-containing protein [Vibrio japonicus]UUM30671.1 putative Ig domain-containing protein [Vibrio japonicus]